MKRSKKLNIVSFETISPSPSIDFAAEFTIRPSKALPHVTSILSKINEGL
jgi:hypothetical protein